MEPTIAPGRNSRGILRDSLVVIRYVWTHPSNSGHRMRAVARALAFQLRGRAFGRPSRIPCGERSVIEISPAQGASGLAYANPLEAPEIAVWRKHLKPGDLFIDVGAHIGSYTLWAIEQGAAVISVEPDPGAAAALRRNLQINSYAADVIEAAVADIEGEVPYTVGLGVLNHIVPEGGPDTRPVPATTLDSIIGSRTAAGVKIDVEGAEALVLRGASRALAEGRIELIQMEWNPQSFQNFGASRDEIAGMLSAAGFELCRPDIEGNLIPIQHLAPGPDVFARRMASRS